MFKEVTDALGAIQSLQTHKTGVEILKHPALNKGTAFTRAEREALGLIGQLPQHVETLEQQAARYYQQYQLLGSDLVKNDFLNHLKGHNDVVFYFLLSQHLQEMLPIVYTPTISEAVKNYSRQFDQTTGLYFSYSNRDKIDQVLAHFNADDIDLIIITDGEGVLGIGDWGAGGIDICTGKLMVYTSCGGINPHRALPIQIDVGTNNEALLNDPLYLGYRQPRVTGMAYDDFIDQVVSAIREKFPHVFLHWEDFGRDNARACLNRYRNQMCTFNDDMQGTGATATACVLSALKAIQADFRQQKVLLFGAGTAGVGIADQICQAFIQQGLSPKEAHDCFYLIDRQGLLLENDPQLLPFQKPYARSTSILSQFKNPQDLGLDAVVKAIQPTILMGCSTLKSAFNESLVKSMAAHCARPIIFPLSNPTDHAEATPEDLIHWTDNRAIVATGSPFEPVAWQGQSIRISQCNNAFVFPGLGLGILASKATRVSDGMITAASNALSEASPMLQDPNAPVLPSITDAPLVSQQIAYRVACQAVDEGHAPSLSEEEILKRIQTIFWTPKYYPIVKEQL